MLYLRQSIQECTKQNLWMVALTECEGYHLPKADHVPSNFLRAAFHKVYWVYS